MFEHIWKTFKLTFSTSDLYAYTLLLWLQIITIPQNWLYIRACVTSASASILINGSPTTPIKLQRGLRQGDPLSPFLFDIVVEPLNLLIQKAISLKLWDGLEVCKNGTKISHLQYADDMILFCSPNIDCLMSIKSTFIVFQLASGLQENFHKSSIIGLNVEKSWLQVAACNLLCKIGELPFTYLGLPIGGNSSSIASWDPILDQTRKKTCFMERQSTINWRTCGAH